MSESFVVGSALSKPQPRMRSVPSVSPQVSTDHVYEIPAKLIKTPADMKIWEKSEAYFEYLGFILAINEAIKGKSNSQGSEKPAEAVIKMVELLDKLDAIVDETPPVQQPQRFGNVAFRTWYQKMRDGSLILLQDVVTQDLFRAILEIVTYLVDSFGNSTRIDYGTGHEISFVMFLCSLFKIGLFKDADKTGIGCYIFPRYLDLVRKLQKTYRMEPAGSHGVWSLDDYQFVPFIWGSSQLFAHPTIEPQGFLNPQVLNEFGDDYMFLTCIQYINSVKTGPFAEHSNQLWSVSGVSSWSKINGGLIKMYKAEVLSKFPVVQHIVFGSLFTLKCMEHSSGMMTAKYSMTPPPVPLSSTSASSSKQSSESSLQSGEEKSLSGGSYPSYERTRPSVGASSYGSKASGQFSARGSVREPSKVSSDSDEKTREDEPPSDHGSDGSDLKKEPSDGSDDRFSGLPVPTNRGISEASPDDSIAESVIRFSTAGSEKGPGRRGMRTSIGERGPTSRF